MTLTDAQKAALAELNEGKSICFGSASTTYNKQEIIAEGLEIADFALMVEALELRTGSRGMKAAGEKYIRHSGSFDGDFSSVAVCLGCESLMQTLFQNDVDGWFHDNGIEYGRAWEYAFELDLVCPIKQRQAFAA